MRKKILSILAVVLVVTGSLAWAINYLALNKQQQLKPGVTTYVNQAFLKNPGQTLDQTVDYTTQLVAQNLYVPWSIVFTSTNRMLVSERSGSIRIIENEVLQPEPLITFNEISSQSEEGLMGLTIDPNYAQNHRLYACLAYAKNGKLYDRVVRLLDQDTLITRVDTLIDNIPAAPSHAGCRLKFGPDDKLYITTGDATDKQIAQDQNSLGGKILRINSDGSFPSDNPFPSSSIYSLGHRNPQGLDWHPLTGDLWATEHGPSVFDGPAGGDEVNLIFPGANYGWPIISHEQHREGLEDPKLVFTPAVAPGSGMFYTADVFPQLRYNFLFGALKGEGIIRVILSVDKPQDVLAFEKLDIPLVGRIRDVVQGPDGLIYFSTSNRDGRGKLREGDDKIYRLVPKK